MKLIVAILCSTQASLDNVKTIITLKKKQTTSHRLGCFLPINHKVNKK